jgi:cell division protein FtsB
VRRIPRRWIALALLALVAFLYWRPVSSYVNTRRSLTERRAEVRSLRAQNVALERRLTASESTAALERQARSLGLVKPGQHLYIVKGIPGWLRTHRATLGGGGR